MKLTVAIVVAVLVVLTHQQNCSSSRSCFARSDQRRIEEIKNTILQELGMQTAPDMSTLSLPSPEMRAEYMRLIEAEHGASSDEKETVFIPAVDPSKGTDRSTLVAHFPIDESYSTKEIQEVKLSFFADLGAATGTAETVMVHVYEKNLDGTLGNIIGSRTVTLSHSKRISVSLKAHDVKRWFTSNPIQGLYVVAKYNGENIALHPQETDDENKNMILTVSWSIKLRRKRSAPPVCSRHAPQAGCCLYDLMVDFKVIGWDWIIAPPRYNAFICRGDCAVNKHHMQVNGHSKLVDIAARIGEEEKKLIESSGSCCHPTEYEPIVMVYLNRENRVAVAHVNGMSARRCNCA